MAARMPLGRICVVLLLLEAAPAAAANCPLKPGKWDGFISGEVVAVGRATEQIAITTEFSVFMELDIACDGKVVGVFRSGTGVFRAFSAGPVAKQGECTLGYSFHFQDGKVELGPDGAPVMVLHLLVTGRLGECKGDYTDIAWRYADRHGVARFRFEAMYPRPERGYFASTRNWEIEHNALLNLPIDATGTKYARNHLWVISPAPDRN
jgi:hypothetical protein